MDLIVNVISCLCGFMVLSSSNHSVFTAAMVALLLILPLVLGIKYYIDKNKKKRKMKKDENKKSLEDKLDELDKKIKNEEKSLFPDKELIGFSSAVSLMFRSIFFKQ
jgi:cadmium resistance protein CadD (predicted permease)